MTQLRSINRPLIFGKPWLQSLQPLLARRDVPLEKVMRGLPDYQESTRFNDYRLSDLQLLKLLGQVEHANTDQHLWQLVAESLLQNPSNPLSLLCRHAPNFHQALRSGHAFKDLVLPFMIVRTATAQHTCTIDFIAVAGDRSKSSQLEQLASYKIAIALVLALGKHAQQNLQQWQLSIPSNIKPMPLWTQWLGNIHHGGIVQLILPNDRESLCERGCHSQFQQAQHFCELQLQSLGGVSPFEVIFDRLLKHISLGEESTLNDIAERVNLSASSLKRLFASVGQSFQSFYDTARMYQLLQLLQHHHYSNAELAQRLGYSNPNNFRRACKRWLGIAPDELRAQQFALKV